MTDHVPCCSLSVECLLCNSDVGEPCDSTCRSGEVCTCEDHGRPCCRRHYPEVTVDV